jgi:hypothetical protein
VTATKFFDLVYVGVTSSGTGATVNLGTTAPDGYRTPSAAGVSTGDTVTYIIRDGMNWEIGEGTISSNTLSRSTILASTNSGSRINLSGSASMFLTLGADTLNSLIALLSKALVNDAIAPIKGYTLTRSALGNITGTATLNLSNGNVFTATVTGAVTLSVSGAPATGSMGEMQIVLTNGGSATVTWPSTFKWPGGTAPTLTASGVDVIVATTVDGGTTWLASHAMKDVK